ALRAGEGSRRRAGAAARRRDRHRARARSRAARARRERRPYLSRARQVSRAVLRLRHADRARGLRGAHGLLLPRLPDRRSAAEGPAALAPPPVKVGDKATRRKLVSARDIELFTELTGDRNPLHYDDDAAGRSRFGRRIVQGGVTTGLLNAVVAEDLPGPGSVFLHVDWSFRAPVYPGD